MFGPAILARTLSSANLTDSAGRKWQYHPRSDRHSKVACWGIVFDLLLNCALLAEHVRKEKVVFGINHEMRDFRMNRKKNLDLVLCTPGTSTKKKKRELGTFPSFVERYDIDLRADEKKLLTALPPLMEGPVGAVHVALEAKAAMTAHVKALPRLYDELNSSHATIHGNTESAIAVGLALINMADTFQSAKRAPIRASPWCRSTTSRRTRRG